MLLCNINLDAPRKMSRLLEEKYRKSKKKIKSLFWNLSNGCSLLIDIWPKDLK